MRPDKTLKDPEPSFLLKYSWLMVDESIVNVIVAKADL